MPKSELRLDTDTLISAGNALAKIESSFRTADQYATEVVGHLGTQNSSELKYLGKELTEFATNWKNRRNRLLDGINALSQATLKIGNTFHDIDKNLGDAIASDAPGDNKPPTYDVHAAQTSASFHFTPSGSGPRVSPNIMQSNPGLNVNTTGIRDADMEQLRTRADQYLSNLENYLNDLDARLAALQQQIKSSMDALAIADLMAKVEELRKYVIWLIQQLIPSWSPTSATRPIIMKPMTDVHTAPTPTVSVNHAAVKLEEAPSSSPEPTTYVSGIVHSVNRVEPLPDTEETYTPMVHFAQAETPAMEVVFDPASIPAEFPLLPVDSYLAGVPIPKAVTQVRLETPEGR